MPSERTIEDLFHNLPSPSSDFEQRAKLMTALDDTAKLKIAVEALEHYGNPDTYSDGFHKFGCDAPNIASDALKQIGEQR